MKMKLEKPVEFGKNTPPVEELNLLDDITVEDIMILPVRPMTWGEYLPSVSKISGMPEAFIKKMSARDYTGACEHVATFLLGGQQTGQK